MLFLGWSFVVGRHCRFARRRQVTMKPVGNVPAKGIFSRCHQLHMLVKGQRTPGRPFRVSCPDELTEIFAVQYTDDVKWSNNALRLRCDTSSPRIQECD